MSLSFKSNFFDALIESFLDDTRKTEILRRSLITSGSSVSGNDRSELADLINKWGDVLNLRNRNILNIDDAIDVSTRLLTGLHQSMDVFSTMQKAIAVIQSDSSLGSVSGTINDIISSGIVSINSATVKAANSLKDVADKLIGFFPNIDQEYSEMDPVSEYFKYINGVYKEYSAALHPYRALDNKLFEHPDLVGKLGLKIDANFAVDFAGTGIIGGESSQGGSYENVHLQAHNLHGTLVVRDSSSVQVLNDNSNVSHIVAARGLTNNLSTAYVPVYEVYSMTSGNVMNVSFSLRREDGNRWIDIEDGTGVTTTSTNGGITAISFRHYRAGVSIKTVTVPFARDGDTGIVSFSDVQGDDYFGAAITGNNIAVPLTTVYNVAEVSITILDASLSSAGSIGRLIDLIASNDKDERYSDYFITSGVNIGLAEVKLIDKYLRKKTSASLVGCVDAFYQSERNPSDTKSAIGSECLDISWWLGTLDGVTPDTKRRVYEYFYETSRDHLNLARANSEFCRFVLNG